jgi:hypothetical protein
VLVVATMFMLIGCSVKLQTASNTEKGAILNNYKTYAWIAPHDPDGKSRADDKAYGRLIHEQVDAALQKKGLVLNSEKPDAVFTFQTKVEERVKYSNAPASNSSFYYGGPGYYMGYGPAVPGGEVLPESYDEGMLSIEMFDANTKKVLWRGWATKPLSAKSDVESDIRKAIKDIIIKLPIKHNQ